MKGCDGVHANAIAWGVTDFLVLILSFVSLMILGDYELPVTSGCLAAATAASLLSFRWRAYQIAMAGDSDTTGYWHFFRHLYEPFAIICLFVGLGYYLFGNWGTLMIGD
jgi:hypothetical protein